MSETTAPGSQASLREANSARILDAVRVYGRITQVELASVTGLSPATVSNIVKELVAHGVAQTSATIRSGRRAQHVSLTRSSGLTAGIHIQQRTLGLYLADASHTVALAQTLRLPPDHRFDTTLDRACLLVAELAEKVGAAPEDVAGIGVAVPTDVGRGWLNAALLPGWDEIDIPGILGARLGCPVLTERETDAAAVAEYRFGALRGATCGLFVRASDTIESSIIIQGRPHRGASNAVGSLGHVRVDPNGPICRCGARGCLNTSVSAESLADLLRVSHGPMSLRAIVQHANVGDPGCRQVIADAGALIGAAIADLATVLAPDRIVVGGQLAEAGDILLTPMRDTLRSRPLLPDADELLIVGQLGSGAAAMGVAALAHDATDHVSQNTEG